MSRLFIEPLDVWLFRDGRPFTGPGDHHARSLFPPSPFTLYGALRTKLLFDAAAGDPSRLADHDFVERTVGGADDFERFRLWGPVPARREHDGGVTRYFPAPLDVAHLEPTATGPGSWAVLRPEGGLPGVQTDVGLALPWTVSATRPETAAGRWLAESEFFTTLEGEPPRVVVSADELYALERRSGIELEWAAPDRPRRVARAGRLFSVAFVRPALGAGLCVDVGGYALRDSSGVLGLGGEARGSRYEVIDARPPDRSAARRRVAESGRLKLVLATPALFSGGWLPRWLDPSTGATTAPIAGLRLRGAAVGRAQPIGGFDVRAGRPRAMRSAVPAGSVYWLEETAAGVAEAAFDVLDGQNISDEYAGIGFGLCYVGGW